MLIYTSTIISVMRVVPMDYGLMLRIVPVILAMMGVSCAMGLG